MILFQVAKRRARGALQLPRRPAAARRAPPAWQHEASTVVRCPASCAARLQRARAGAGRDCRKCSRDQHAPCLQLRCGCVALVRASASHLARALPTRRCGACVPARAAPPLAAPSAQPPRVRQPIHLASRRPARARTAAAAARLAAAMRSVLTLQLGTYANYVGAHFWNLQARLAGVPATQRAASR